ncbi:MAG TPA: hypothetical protein PK971_06760 [Saprospiraceae bacterium]|nr:hypothetical protein [Saprospiraceae bacterium]
MQAYIRYLADVKQLRAEATFTEGDSVPKPVEMAGGVLFQGLPMKLRPMQGITYQTEYAAEYSSPLKFAWSLAPQQPQTEVSVQMLPLTAFSFEQEPISLRSPNTFRWQGGKVEDGEAFVFLWERIGDGLTVKMEVVQSLVGAEIRFPAAKLAELQPGRWKLYLVRKRLHKTQVGGVQVQAVSEYYSKTDTLELKN